MTFWLIIWTATSGVGVGAFYLLAVHDPATPLPHIAASGPVLAAVFMAVQLPASLLATEAARVMHRRARARRERALVARLRRELAGP
jgi:hypothetical protein